MKKITAYKVFNPDWTCRGFQYEVGKSYSMKEKPSLCNVGFHACLKLVDCFNYYGFNPNNKVAVVEMSGDIADDNNGDKIASNNIKIVSELSWGDVLSMVNVGKGNSGMSNSGNMNSGNRNSGNWNSGNWNSGNWNSGFFNNSTETTVRVFGISISRKLFDKWNKPEFLYFYTTKWILKSEMTKEEKKQHKDFHVCGGYLKTFGYKEAFKESFDKASIDDKNKMWSCPNFNAEIFFDISGIDWYLDENNNPNKK